MVRKTTAGKKTKEKKQKKDKEIYPPLNPKPLYSPRWIDGSRKRATAGSRSTKEKPGDGVTEKTDRRRPTASGSRKTRQQKKTGRRSTAGKHNRTGSRSTGPAADFPPAETDSSRQKAADFRRPATDRRQRQRRPAEIDSNRPTATDRRQQTDGRQIFKAGNRQRIGRRERGKRDLGIRGIYISLFLCYFLLLFAAAGKVRREKGRGL